MKCRRHREQHGGIAAWGHAGIAAWGMGALQQDGAELSGPTQLPPTQLPLLSCPYSTGPTQLPLSNCCYSVAKHTYSATRHTY